jgi:hypothetical protein
VPGTIGLAANIASALTDAAASAAISFVARERLKIASGEAGTD